MRHFIIVCTSIASGVMLLSMRSLGETPSFQGIGIAPGFSSSALVSISGDGSVGVGHGAISGCYQAFTWTQANGFAPLGDLSGDPNCSLGWGISDDGSVAVGDANVALFPPAHSEAFVFVKSAMIGLGIPNGAVSSYSRDVSGDGLTVLFSHYLPNDQGSFGAIWTAGNGLTDLGDLPGGTVYCSPRAISADGSVVVGTSSSSNGVEAFIWDAQNGMQGLGDLPGGSVDSEAVDVSPNGAIVVGSGLLSVGREAFRWTSASGVVALGELPGGAHNSQASGVSSDGAIVVGSSAIVPGKSGYPQAAFIWDNHYGMRELRQTLLDMGITGLEQWELHFAHDVSSDGRTIIGSGLNPQAQFEGFIVRLPGPGDLTADGIVNIDDLLEIINGWGACSALPTYCSADVSPLPFGDGEVNIDDLLQVINNWG